MPKIGKNLPIFTDFFTDSCQFFEEFFNNVNAVHGKNHVPFTNFYCSASF